MVGGGAGRLNGARLEKTQTGAGLSPNKVKKDFGGEETLPNLIHRSIKINLFI